MYLYLYLATQAISKRVLGPCPTIFSFPTNKEGCAVITSTIVEAVAPTATSITKTDDRLLSYSFESSTSHPTSEQREPQTTERSPCPHPHTPPSPTSSEGGGHHGHVPTTAPPVPPSTQTTGAHENDPVSSSSSFSSRTDYTVSFDFAYSTMPSSSMVAPPESYTPKPPGSSDPRTATTTAGGSMNGDGKSGDPTASSLSATHTPDNDPPVTDRHTKGTGTKDPSVRHPLTTDPPVTNTSPPSRDQTESVTTSAVGSDKNTQTSSTTKPHHDKATDTSTATESLYHDRTTHTSITTKPHHEKTTDTSTATDLPHHDETTLRSTTTKPHHEKSTQMSTATDPLHHDETTHTSTPTKPHHDKTTQMSATTKSPPPTAAPSKTTTTTIDPAGVPRFSQTTTISTTSSSTTTTTTTTTTRSIPPQIDHNHPPPPRPPPKKPCPACAEPCLVDLDVTVQAEVPLLVELFRGKIDQALESLRLAIEAEILPSSATGSENHGAAGGGGGGGGALAQAASGLFASLKLHLPSSSSPPATLDLLLVDLTTLFRQTCADKIDQVRQRQQTQLETRCRHAVVESGRQCTTGQCLQSELDRAIRLLDMTISAEIARESSVLRVEIVQEFRQRCETRHQGLFSAAAAQEEEQQQQQQQQDGKKTNKRTLPIAPQEMHPLRRMPPPAQPPFHPPNAAVEKRAGLVSGLVDNLVGDNIVDTTLNAAVGEKGGGGGLVGTVLDALDLQQNVVQILAGPIKVVVDSFVGNCHRKGLLDFDTEIGVGVLQATLDLSLRLFNILCVRAHVDVQV
ncbi:hypothetical protein DFQ26_000801 [Actinomortierella ambigua]|nr:hypothetical protein DFQ26_000801 [Actinomortierella ambigua]